MCILQPCANPTEVGVWWRDDTKWCRYQPENERLIRQSIRQNLRSIDLGSIASTTHPEGWRYTANLEKMEQVAVSTGQKRGIMVIDPPAAPAPQLPAPRPPVVAARINLPPAPAPTVHYRDSSGQLQQYDSSVARALLETMVGGRRSHLIVQDSRTGNELFFDLKTMRQREIAFIDNDSREIVFKDDGAVEFFVEVPWNPAALTAIAKTANQDMRRKILRMVVDRYRSDQHLDAVLPAKAHPRMIVSKRMNDAVVPGHPTYEKFLDCLEGVIGKSPGAFDLLIKSTDPSSASFRDTSILKLAFKPPADQDADDSRAMSAPPGKRQRSLTDTNQTKSSLWMSMLTPAAAAQASALVFGCAMQLRVLVYFVILSPETWRQTKSRGTCAGDLSMPDCVSIDNPAHSLRVGEVLIC